MKFRNSFIIGESKSTKNPGELLNGVYDILILGASWDTRSTWVVDIGNIEAGHCILVTYENEDLKGIDDDAYERQLRNGEILERYMGDISHSTKTERSSAYDIEEKWMRIYANILEVYEREKRPLNICLDISAIPRYCVLSALGMCIKNGIASEMVFLYAEGDYKIDAENVKYISQVGGWKKINIKALESVYDPAKRDFYLVSIGFEGNRTLRVTSESEPRRVSLLFPDPPVKDGYVEETAKENRRLIEKYRIPETQIIRAAAGDAIEAWKKLTVLMLERPESENAFYLCCGTKPHALALGLRALAKEFGTVVYYIPDRKVPTDVGANGTFWKYTIRDISVLPS